jgi:DNA-binding NarL/FixJ family response regulator
MRPGMARSRRTRTPRAAPRRIAVLVTDDHPIVRQGLRRILEDAPDLAVAGEATNAREVLEHVRRGGCDVVLLDLVIPGANGLELLEQVLRERPGLPVLVLTMYPEEQFAVRAFQSGAAGYLNKEGAPEQLLEAIRKVHAGGRYVTPSLAERLAADLSRAAPRVPHELLSNREHQVLCLLAKPLSVKQIAQQLHLSEKTVSTYRTRVLEKLRLETTAALIRYAIENRLVD